MEREKTNDHACGVEIQSGRVEVQIVYKSQNVSKTSAFVLMVDLYSVALFTREM